MTEWKLVPVDATEEMTEAAWVAFRDSDKPAPWNQIRDAINAALSASPPPPSDGWRDIASAPKDGTRFLTWTKTYGVRVGMAYHRADHDDWLSHLDAYGNSSKGGMRPTHWMPLPSAPGSVPPAWPAGCPKNSSCARHQACMYGCATHKGRPQSDLAAEIDAETARRSVPPAGEEIEAPAFPSDDGMAEIYVCNAPPGVVSSGPEVTTKENVHLWRGRGWACTPYIAISAFPPAGEEKLREALREARAVIVEHDLIATNTLKMIDEALGEDRT